MSLEENDDHPQVMFNTWVMSRDPEQLENLYTKEEVWSKFYSDLEKLNQLINTP